MNRQVGRCVMIDAANVARSSTRRDFLRWSARTTTGAAFYSALGSAWARPDDSVAGQPMVDPPGIARHPAMFWDRSEDRIAICRLCPRQCSVPPGQRGHCGVRENSSGDYDTLVYGALCSANVDPIEKKPLFHYLPGTEAFSVATAGCNIGCKFCQNWQISQARPEDIDSQTVPPKDLVSSALARSCSTIAFTYAEPTIFYEYMHDTAGLAREAGLGAVMISNGYINTKPMQQLCRRLTAVKVDFKAYSDKFYREVCAATLQPVLSTLRTIREEGVWLELVMLVIPTLNDSSDEVKAMCEWILKNLGPDVPIHFTRFRPMYRLTNLPRTPVSTLEQCRSIALHAGIHYAYAGNVPMHEGENTYCHSCGHKLIHRAGFRVTANLIVNGRCPQCGATIPGIWSSSKALSVGESLHVPC